LQLPLLFLLVIPEGDLLLSLLLPFYEPIIADNAVLGQLGIRGLVVREQRLKILMDDQL
jgi:hypothetical protein